MLCITVMCCAGSLHVQRSVQAAVRVRFADDFHLDWDGRGRVLLKVGGALIALIEEWSCGPMQNVFSRSSPSTASYMTAAKL